MINRVRNVGPDTSDSGIALSVGGRDSGVDGSMNDVADSS